MNYFSAFLIAKATKDLNNCKANRLQILKFGRRNPYFNIMLPMKWYSRDIRPINYTVTQNKHQEPNVRIQKLWETLCGSIYDRGAELTYK